MRTALLMVASSCLLVLVAAAPAAAQVSPLEAGINELRAQRWSPDTLQSVVSTLIAEGHLQAASWWLTAAEEVLAEKRLPARAKGTISKLRRQIATVAKKDKEAKQLKLRTAKHARTMISRKAPDEAEAAVSLAERMAVAFDDPAFTRLVQGVRKRRDRMDNTSGGDAKLPQKLKDETRRIELALSDLLSRKVTEGIEQFGKFGCKAGYRAISANIAARGTVLDDGGQAQLAGLRKAARDLGLGKSLTLYMLGRVRVRVYQDCGVLELPDTEDGFYDASEFRAIDVQALPGEQIAFEVKLSEAALKAGSKRFKPREELIVHARWNERNLPVSVWQVTRKKHLRSMTPKLKGIRYSKKTPHNELRGPDGKPVIFMNYYDPLDNGGKKGGPIGLDPNNLTEEDFARLFRAGRDGLMTAYGSWHQELEEEIKEHAKGFHWVVTLVQDPVYVITLPE